MSRLRIFDAADPSTPLSTSHDGAEIARELAAIGVHFERWQASQPLPERASQAQVLEAYREDVDRLVAEHGFNSVDVAAVYPDHPEREKMRRTFLDEHYHKEDEVRFFVEGSGLFTLHVDGRVYEVECVKNDLISVPDGTPHWFDMGPEPHFVAIRFFKEPDGWVGHFTGSGIAARFPRYEHS